MRILLDQYIPTLTEPAIPKGGEGRNEDRATKGEEIKTLEDFNPTCLIINQKLKASESQMDRLKTNILKYLPFNVIRIDFLEYKTEYNIFNIRILALLRDGEHNRPL